MSNRVNGLTIKQNRFIEEYLIDFNTTQASIRSGYSVKSARQVGCINMHNKNIKAVIDSRLAEMKSNKIATATEVMEYLSKIMRGEEIEEVISIVGIGNGFSDIKTSNKKISAKDKLKASELLAKRYGLLTEKLELNGEVVVFKGEELLED